MARAAAALAASLLVSRAAAAQPRLATTYGDVLGETVDGVNIFRSIPFAAPPVGARRFANPVPPAPWAAPRDVRAYPTPCAQLKLLGPLLYGGEDCLQLSVFAPANADRLPVLFWIFGGAYALGDSEELGWYDGAALAKARNVVVVAANYRVGPFGFMALDALRAEAGAGGSTGNAALLDQVLALEWTRDNVAGAGGDAGRVTIFGESAGAFSVGWHLASPRSAGLFHAAILESGTLAAEQFFTPVADAIAFNTLYAAAIGCGGAGAAQLACLRALPADGVLEALGDDLNPDWPFKNQTRPPIVLPALAPVMPWGPAIDGVALPAMPQHAVEAGTFNRVPVIMGTNRNEGSIFIPIFVLIVRGFEFPPRQQDIPALIEHAFDMYDAAVVRAATLRVLPTYPLSAYDGDSWAQASDMLTHAFFSCATRRATRALAKAGVNTWVYQFSHDLHWPEVQALPELGDYHTSELDFVFNHSLFLLNHTFNKADADVSRAFQAWWSNFAASGDPNVGGAPTPLDWPRFAGPAGEASAQIQVPFSITTDLLAEECAAWDEFQAALDASGTRDFGARKAAVRGRLRARAARKLRE